MFIKFPFFTLNEMIATLKTLTRLRNIHTKYSFKLAAVVSGIFAKLAILMK